MSQDEDHPTITEKYNLEGRLYLKQLMRWYPRTVILDLEQETIYISKIEGDKDNVVLVEEEDSMTSEVVSTTRPIKKGTDICKKSYQSFENCSTIIPGIEN